MCTITSSNHPINIPILSFWQTFTVFFFSLVSMERTIQKRRCEPPAKWLNKQNCMHIVNKSRCIRIICVFNGKRLKNVRNKNKFRREMTWHKSHFESFFGEWHSLQFQTCSIHVFYLFDPNRVVSVCTVLNGRDVYRLICWVFSTLVHLSLTHF